MILLALYYTDDVQEWAPLLPVLHRPSFLRIYEEYLSNPEAGHWHSNKQAVAQLFLIFEIAALSSVVSFRESFGDIPLAHVPKVTYQAEYDIVRAPMAQSPPIDLFHRVSFYFAVPYTCAVVLPTQSGLPSSCSS